MPYLFKSVLASTSTLFRFWRGSFKVEKLKDGYLNNSIQRPYLVESTLKACLKAKKSGRTTA